MDKQEELRQWFSIADTDLAAAEHLLSAGSGKIFKRVFVFT
jgi:hypothetical protein